MDLQETKKFARAFEDQETKNGEDAEKWMIISLLLGVVLFCTVLLGSHFSQGKEWFDHIPGVLVNLAFGTMWVFSSKQVSLHKMAQQNYGNRKTIAQSYHNILSSEEDEPIKSKFLEKATDILCASVDLKDGPHTLPEKALDAITELAKKIPTK